MKRFAPSAKWLALSLLFLPILSSAQTNPTPPQDRLDQRIFNHYSESEVSDMLLKHPQKIKKLNYYYRQSYWVKDNPNCLSCPDLDVQTFDVQNYEHLRPSDRKKAISLGDYRQYIILKPRKTLQVAYLNL